MQHHILLQIKTKLYDTQLVFYIIIYRSNALLKQSVVLTTLYNTFIFRTVGIYKHSLAVFLVFQPLTSVPGSIFEPVINSMPNTFLHIINSNSTLHRLLQMCLFTSSSRMHVMNHNWSATKQHLHPQSVAEQSRHSVLSADRIRQCGTSSGSRHKDTDQCL